MQRIFETILKGNLLEWANRAIPYGIAAHARISQNFELRYNRQQAKTLTTKSMFTYSKVLNQVKSLTLSDQLRLLEDLKKMIQLREEVAEDDEVISAEEIAESEAAWQDYQAKRDRGISSQELKRKLFGENN